jgi:filamentous hemagglutinin
MCSFALAKSILTMPDVPKPVVTSKPADTQPVNAMKQRPMTALPNIDWKPGEPWPGQWIKYPADEVLPNGISVEVTGGVITGVIDENPNKAKHDILGTRYVVGDIDTTDVTPALWRTLDMEMPKPDGSIAKLSVARPLWWLQETKAKSGGTVDIGMQEVGISGEAQVLKIKPCPHDSRDNRKGMNLVIGKIEHQNAEVWELVFDNNSDKPLGVTANHPIFSFDRNDWIPAGELRLSERVKTLKVNGSATLTAKSQHPTRETVYNLEVHRSHAYHVADQGILAHNNNILTCSIAGGKLDYLFGRVVSGQHNTARSLENLAQMRRVGLWDDVASRTVIQNHLTEAAQNGSNVVRRFTTEHGTFVVKESLLQGPSGKFVKFESTWEEVKDGILRLTTVIPFGG